MDIGIKKSRLLFWTQLAQNGVRHMKFVNTVMEFRSPG